MAVRVAPARYPSSRRVRANASDTSSTTDAANVGVTGGGDHWRTRATSVITRVRQTVGDHQHGQGRGRVAAIAAGLAVLVVVAGGTGGPFVSSASGATHGGSPQTGGNSVQASDHPSLNLPIATIKPSPALPSVASSAPLQSHEIFGYAPYWTLPVSSSFDVNDLTTLAYFSVDANRRRHTRRERCGLERLREPGPGQPGDAGACGRGPGRAHGHLLQPIGARHHHLGSQRSRRRCRRR